MSKDRKPNRSADQIVADLQARIEAVKARDARRKAKARPEVQLAIVARRALRKAHEAAEDAALKTALASAHETVLTAINVATPENAESVGAKPVTRERRRRATEGAS